MTFLARNQLYLPLPQASATAAVVYGYKSPYFSTDTRTVSLFQTGTPDNPTFSELTIEKLEQPLKCDTKYPVSVKYSFVGETGDYIVDIVYMVSGVLCFDCTIVHL